MRRRIFAHVFVQQKKQDEEPEHEGAGIEPRELFAVVEKPHQDRQIDDANEEDQRLDLLVHRDGGFFDRVGRHQPYAHQIDGKAERGVIDESEGEAAQHYIPVGHAEELRHHEARDRHDRRHDEPAHGRRAFDRSGELPRYAVLLHQRDGEGADHRRIGRPAAADHADRGRGQHGRLRDRDARLAGDPPHELDHRALGVEAGRRRSQEQEGADRRQRDLRILPVDAGRELDCARCDHAVEGGPRVPEEIDRTEIAPHGVDHQDHVHPEQIGVDDPRQFHHQEEYEQSHDEVRPGVGALAPDGDLLVLAHEMIEGEKRRFPGR